MSQHKGDFDQDLFAELLTRKDLSHLLYSDVNNMIDNIQKDFPDIIKTYSIGQSWQERDIRVIELDARHFLQSKGIEELIANEKTAVATNATGMNSTANATSTAQANATSQSEDSKDVADLSEEELLERNEDITRTEKAKKQAFQDKFNKVSDEDKAAALND